MSRRSAISHRASQQRAASRMTPGTRMWSEQPYTNPAGRAVVAEPEYVQSLEMPEAIGYGSNDRDTMTSTPALGWRQHSGGLTPSDYAAMSRFGINDTALVVAISRGVEANYDPQYATLQWSQQWGVDRVKVWTISGIPDNPGQPNRAYYEPKFRWEYTAADPKYGELWHHASMWTFFRNLDPAGKWSVTDVHTAEDLNCVLVEPSGGVLNIQAVGMLNSDGSRGGWQGTGPSGWADTNFGVLKDMGQYGVIAAGFELIPKGALPSNGYPTGGDSVTRYASGQFRNDGTFPHDRQSVYGPSRYVSLNILWGA